MESVIYLNSEEKWFRGEALPYCAKCGKELDNDATFCPKCGASVGAEGKTELKARGTEKKRQEACFGPPGSGGGLWGAISFGVFIIGLAILWIFDYFWPGILFLIALMVIMGALVAYSRK
jgi:hypothetical protein